MSELYSDSIFWIEVDKIRPNPYQPRREFDEARLEDLGESIRQYGVLQPLVVTRHEIPRADGGLAVEYELIAGERRLRASKLVGVQQVPVVIRTGEDNSKMKLELAIIENLQREDLNPVDRAKAFQRFIDDFNYKHIEIAKKVGKSREYVSNSLRLLMLPDEILEALTQGRISEGHARPLMMLNDRADERDTLFKEIQMRKMTVREAEKIARRIARDKVRKRTREFDPEIVEMEERLIERFGTRVRIEPREIGGKILIDFFDDNDLKKLLESVTTQLEAHYVPGDTGQNQVTSDESQQEKFMDSDTTQQNPYVENYERHEESHDNDFDSLIEGRVAQNPVAHIHEEYVEEKGEGDVIMERDTYVLPSPPMAPETQSFSEEHRAYVAESENISDEKPVQARTDDQRNERKDEGDDLYFVRNFSV